MLPDVLRRIPGKNNSDENPTDSPFPPPPEKAQTLDKQAILHQAARTMAESAFNEPHFWGLRKQGDSPEAISNARVDELQEFIPGLSVVLGPNTQHLSSIENTKQRDGIVSDAWQLIFRIIRPDLSNIHRTSILLAITYTYNPDSDGHNVELSHFTEGENAFVDLFRTYKGQYLEGVSYKHEGGKPVVYGSFIFNSDDENRLMELFIQEIRELHYQELDRLAQNLGRHGFVNSINYEVLKTAVDMLRPKNEIKKKYLTFLWNSISGKYLTRHEPIKIGLSQDSETVHNQMVRLGKLVKKLERDAKKKRANASS